MHAGPAEELRRDRHLGLGAGGLIGDRGEGADRVGTVVPLALQRPALHLLEAHGQHTIGGA